ncbi:TonB-dependent receptor domain-containing protein [Alteromonas lipolytica]|uniref:TonB-dependent receptor n=1 Tax=Alteromonas lipolytica TaxID=1856405 RepID=A0A1E8FIZ5_9ALTE|nr:TonB-dependent receptor [Alteromonas lipolytica]OFI35907.1 TonB-dependent receptor [Alteromonas lipolytica]GGF72698.1 TonB-dependent receptor [Alteromonas lipolytica]
MFTNTKLAKSVKLAFALSAASAALIAPNTVLAQESSEVDEASVEKIQVTGSRIRKIEFASNAPIATVGEQEFEMTATVNTESLLNTMPQVVPGLDRTSNNPGNGTATADLRGLGANRTLVLVNGKRVTPTTASGVVDINAIPTAMIENVEVLTGGASAVYGSDAISGVINFILKDDFEGVDASVGYESTEEGDAGIWNADLTIGGNFDDGKGNVVFNMAYTSREDLFQGDRSFANTALFDDGAGGLEPGGSSGVPQTAIFAGGFSDFSDSSGIIFGQDGSVRPFVTSGQVNDYYNYAPVNYIQLPQERHQFSALGHYEVTDNMEVYGSAMFTDSNVPSQLAPTPIFQTSTFTLDGNPFISPEAQQIISGAIGLGVDTDGDGIDDEGRALLRRRLEEVGPRRSEDTFTSFQVMGGVRGFFGDSSWSYDVYYQTGRVRNANAQLGNVNRGRFDQALLLATDENGQVILDANGNPSCADTSNNGSTVGCTPLNIFGEGNISESSAAFLRTAVSATSTFEQRLFGANITGDTEGFFELPGGPIGLSFTYEHREDDFEFLPSQDLAASTIAGFNGSPAVAGGFNVSSYAVEAYLPILVGAPFAELLDLELAYRTEDYTTAGSVSAYKIAGSWAPIDSFRLRAGFNTAVRAPNISELFSPQGENFPGATDPCAGNAPEAFKTAEVADLCVQTGVPADVVHTAAINPASGQVRALSGGNPNLVEEEAETLTVGFVFDATDEISLSLDYFDIEIDDAVSSFGGGANNILDTCYDSSKAGSGLGGAFCNAINRRSDGTIDYVEAGTQNVASITLKGYDLIASYETEVMGGDLSVRYLGTYTTESDFLPFDGSPDLIECAGNFGANCGEPVPEYKHRTTMTYSADDYTLQLLWRYVGEVSDDDDSQDYTVEKIDGFNYFDVAGTYFLTENFRVTAGVDNMFDKTPPIIGGNDEQSNTYPATYDVFGRTYYVNFRVSY